MELADFHAIIYIRKSFVLSICFVFFLGPYAKEVIHLLIWENKRIGKDSKPLENLVDTLGGKLPRKVLLLKR